jgi:hypothetical protein
VPDDADYCMLLERQGIGLSHARVKEDRLLSDEEIILYLAHSRVTEQRASEQVAQMLECLQDDKEVGGALPSSPTTRSATFRIATRSCCGFATSGMPR